MRRLRLIGLSGDGRDVLFMDDANVECAAPADERLRAALRGDRARLGQLEIEMESALRPRDIQSRIRAGQTPDDVAALAQVSVERIMPYCVPVLAERQHVAEQAGRGFVRRANAEGAARRLADVVADRLRSRGLDPQDAEWDAWRRDDGRWSVQAAYQSGGSEHQATFVYDAVGRYSLADDDEARWLTGEKQATRKGPQPRESRPADESPAGIAVGPDADADATSTESAPRRLAAVPTGEDLLSLTLEVETESEPVDLPTTPHTTASEAPQVESSPPTAVLDEPWFAAEPDPATVIEGLADSALPEQPDVVEPAGTADEPDVSDDLTAVVRAVRETAEAPPAEHADDQSGRKRSRNGRRASIPSWDEIMFGRGADR